MPLKQSYFDWNRALIPQVKEALLSEAPKCESTQSYNQAIDLSHLLVIVPTAKSGQHLLEALSTDTQTQKNGLLIPEIITPIQFIEQAISSENRATEADCLLAWVQVLNRYPAKKLRAIFPNTSPSKANALDHAKRFHRLRKELGIEGFDLASVAEICAEEAIEPRRWATLADLEKDYYKVLGDTGLSDPLQASLACAENYPFNIRFSKIIIVATPDPNPLPLKAFKQLEKTHALEVWINGPSGDLFDPWGRPNPEKWENRALDLDSWNYQIHRLNQSLDIPEVLVGEIADRPVESLQIGLLDPNLIEPISHYFSTASVPYYNPEGLPMSDSALGKCILSLLLFQDEQSNDRLKQLLLNPYFYQSAPVNQSIEESLTNLDTLFEAHLCHNLVDLKAQIGTQTYTKLSEFSKLIDYAEKFIYPTDSKQAFVEWLKERLNHILNQVDLLDIDSVFKNLIESISQTFEEALAAEKRFSKELDRCGQSVLTELLNKQKIYKERESEAHDLFGWLELLWHDAPHSILCGLNEGIVPRSRSNDAFLPEHLKCLLGMQSQEQSYANDLYLFEAIGRKRSLKNGLPQGKLSIFLPESDTEGNPLMPSRLLFQVPDSKLLENTQNILLKKTDTIQFHEHRPAWIIDSALPATRPNSISVSALKDYLHCPFRFYLKHILKLRSKNFGQRELSVAEFGTLFHRIVATLEGESFQAKSDEKAWIDRLHRTADRLIASQYGANLSFALKMQKESIRDRLSAFIRSQFTALKESGQNISIVETEKQFELALGSFTLRGTIDRIDFDSDGIHIIDYKTSNSAKNPQAVHLKSAQTQQEPKHLPEAAYLSLGNKDYYWSDLQLPLYALAQMSESQSADLPRLSYYSIPKSAEKTELANWVDFDQSILNSAKDCALAVLKNIEAGEFWPPNEHIDPMYDPFAQLFPDGIQKTVDARLFNPFTYNNDLA